jgi:hypothetical protein
MSSILDALKRLEAEKAAKLAVEDTTPRAFKADQAQTNLLADASKEEQVGGPVWSKKLVAALAAGAFLLMTMTTASSLLIFKLFMAPAQETVLAQSSPTQAVPPRVAVEGAPETTPPPQVEPQPTTPAPLVVSEAPPPVVSKPKPEVGEPAPAPPAPAHVFSPPPVRETPPPPPPREIRPASVAPVRLPELIEAPTGRKQVDYTKVPLESLPVLRDRDRRRLGLDSMRINVLRAKGPRRPNPVAIINLSKVYIGDLIPNTRAKLIGIRMNGIGIAMQGSNERFFVEQ